MADTPSSPPPAHQKGSVLLWLAAFAGWTLLLMGATAAVCLIWAGKVRLGDEDKPQEPKGPTYEASMNFLVNRVQPFTLFPEERGEAADPSQFVSFQRTQATLLKSRLVLNAALKQPKAAELKLVRDQADPVEWLETQLEVEFTSPEIMRVRLSGEDPEELKVLLNAVADAYLNEVVFKEHNRRLARIEQLKNIAQTYQAKLADKKRALKELAKLAGAKNPKNLLLQQQLLLEQISSAQKDLSTLQRERRIREIELKLLEEKLQTLANAPIAEPLILGELNKDPVVREFLSREVTLKLELEKAKKLVNPKAFAEMSKETAKEIKVVQDALEQHRKEMRPEIIKRLRGQQVMEPQQQIDELKTKMTFSDEWEKRLTEDIERWSKMNQNVNVQGLEIEGLNDDITQVEAIAKKAMTEAEKMEVERHAPPRVSKLEVEPIVRKLK